MTCEDCVHYEVCLYHITEETEMTVSECTNFKDKSKIIELPCKVGNTVWSIVPIWMTKDKIQSKTYNTLFEIFEDWYIGSFGKYIFLTREKAEKALKERETMREILYRGKRVDNGEWVYGHIFQNKRSTQWVVRTETNDYEVKHDSIGQYTGLTDKNGIKIFCGDILKSDNGHIGYVEFGGLAQFGKYCECHKEFETIYPDNETVIGNIHDNKLEDFGKNTEKLRGN